MLYFLNNQVILVNLQIISGISDPALTNIDDIRYLGASGDMQSIWLSLVSGKTNFPSIFFCEKMQAC